MHPQIQVDMVKRKADELIRNFILNDKRSLLVTYGAHLLYIIRRIISFHILP